jgi:hypothetical protein
MKVKAKPVHRHRLVVEVLPLHRELVVAVVVVDVPVPSGET